MVTTLACIGYLLFGTVSGLSAAANFYGRNPSPGHGSLALLVCLFCAWRIFTLLRSLFRTISRPDNVEEPDV